MSISSRISKSQNRRHRKPLKGQGWELRAKQMIRNELIRGGVTHDELVHRLADLGVTENVPNLRNKISRGRFTAAWLLQVLTAVGARSVDIEGAGTDLAFDHQSASNDRRAGAGKQRLQSSGRSCMPTARSASRCCDSASAPLE